VSCMPAAGLEQDAAIFFLILLKKKVCQKSMLYFLKKSMSKIYE